MKTLFYLIFLALSGIFNSHAFAKDLSNKGIELEKAIRNWTFKHEIVEVSSSKKYQYLVDQAYRKIFSTKSAEKICRILRKGDTEVISNIFGTSNKESKNIDKICSEYRKDPNIAQYRPGSVRLFFVFPEDNNFPLIGWSNKFGHTFLFLKDKNNIDEKELVRSLAHELMIRLDLKNFLRYYMTMNSFEGDVVNLKFNVNYTPKDKCRALSAFNNPLLRAHFISERARSFEFAVLKELFNDEVGESYKELTCVEKIRSNQKQLASIDDEFNRVDNDEEEFSYRSAAQKNNCKIDDSLSRLEKDIDFILNEEINFYKGKQNLCKFFSEPWFQILPLFLNSGPGPRIGGGTN